MVPQYVTCIRCKLICIATLFKVHCIFVCIKVYQFKYRSLKANKFYPSFARQSFKFVLNVTDTINKIIKVASTSVCLFFVLFCHTFLILFVFIASSEISDGKTLPYSSC